MNTYLVISGVLHDACREGQFETVKWIIRKWKFSGKEARQNNNALLRCAFWSGKIDLVDYIINLFKFTRDEIMFQDNVLLAIACKRGHVHLATWVNEKYNIEIDDISLVLTLCVNTSSIQWLINNFDVSANDVKESRILPSLYELNHLSAIEFILKTFELRTVEDVNFDIACAISNISVVKLITHHIVLTNDSFIKDDYKLFKAVSHNKPDVVKFLVEKYDINAPHTKFQS